MEPWKGDRRACPVTCGAYLAALIGRQVQAESAARSEKLVLKL